MLINNTHTAVIPITDTREGVGRMATKIAIKKAWNQSLDEFLGVHNHGNILKTYPLIEPQRTGKWGAVQYQLDPIQPPGQ